MKTKMLLLTALFAALTAVGAFLKIPIPPVAITLQTLFMVLAGLLLGAKYGALSQLVYVALGLVGLPIFTQGGGFSYVLMPSFGFLLGLIPSPGSSGSSRTGPPRETRLARLPRRHRGPSTYSACPTCM